MLFVFSLLLLFINFVSFYIYNVAVIDSKLTNRERKNKNENLLSKIFFIKYFKNSNKFFWTCNLINIVVSLTGILWTFANMFIRNERIDNFISSLVFVTFLLSVISMLISKLLIHIFKSKSWLGKVFLTVYLIVFIVSIIFIFI